MIQHYMEEAVRRGASDILIIAGLPVSYKINGQVIRSDGERLLPKDTRRLLEEIYGMAGHSIEALINSGDDDFSFSLPGLSRFRVNALRQRGSLGMVIRVLAFDLPNRKNLGIPDNVMAFANSISGLVLFTGAAGCGKTTSLACLVDQVNNTRSAHIITIEDPIEYLHPHKKSIVTQRELTTDTQSYDVALRSALREAPDFILLGEMRDSEAIKAAVTAAETGHLVVSTLHTLGAANTVDRIIDAFPPEQQHQIRIQLSLVLEGIVSQQLIPAKDGGLIPAFEVLTVSNAVRNMVRESRVHQLNGIITTSASEGMISMDQSLFTLVQENKITPETALRYSLNPDWLRRRFSEK